MARLNVEVTARRWEHGWELHVSDGREPLVVLPTRRLSAAERTVRDFVVEHEGVEPAVGGGPDHRHARRGARRGDRRRAGGRSSRPSAPSAATAARSRALALRLRDFGLSGADIAVVLGVSPQRVSQLMRTTGC